MKIFIGHKGITVDVIIEVNGKFYVQFTEDNIDYDYIKDDICVCMKRVLNNKINKKEKTTLESYGYWERVII